jgi:RNA polymerase sigma factor (sigma-70 family)
MRNMEAHCSAACTHTEGREFEKKHARLKGLIERYAFYLTGTTQNADDIAQEIFIKLWLQWDRLKNLDEDNLEDYVYVMVRNYIINTGKRKSTARKYTQYYLKSCSDSYLHDEVLLCEGFKLYQEAVNLLPPKERLVYQFHVADYSRYEIAATVQRSENTIDNQLGSAYKSVRCYLNKNFGLNIRESGRKKCWKMAALN